MSDDVLVDGGPGDDDEPPLSGEEEAALGRLEAELERVLGPEVGIGAIELDPGGPPIRVRATLMSDGMVRQVEAEGADLDAACAALVREAAGVETDASISRIVGDI